MLKQYFIFFLGVLFFIGCKDDTLPSKQITKIPVFRNVKEVTHVKNNDNQENAEEREPNQVIEVRKTVEIQNNLHRPSYSSSKPSKYHIIVASCTHAERGKAEKLVHELKMRGYPAELIDIKGRLRVSIENFDDEKEARIQRDLYRRDTDREDIWLLKIP